MVPSFSSNLVATQLTSAYEVMPLSNSCRFDIENEERDQQDPQHRCLYTKYIM